MVYHWIVCFIEAFKNETLLALTRSSSYFHMAELTISRHDFYFYLLCFLEILIAQNYAHNFNEITIVMKPK